MVARVVSAFFRNFFRILLAFVCVSQWVTLWWLFGAEHHLPFWVHSAAIVALWIFNSRLARGSHRFGRMPAPPCLPARIYFASAFASVFAFAFLIVAVSARFAFGIVESTLLAHTSLSVPIPMAGDGAFTTFTQIGIAWIGLVFLYGYTIGQSRVRVRHFDVRLRTLPPALDGLRIAHITDIHMGQNLEPEQLAAYVSQVNAIGADLICVTGDMIDSPRTDIDLFLPIFAELRARLGVYAILGNHDHAAGAERVVEGLSRHTDFTLLRDSHLPLPIGDDTLHLIGLDDRGQDWARGLLHDPKLDTLFARVPRGAPVILLNHRPDLFEHAASLGVDLMLAGHTHGGQVAVPWFTGGYLSPSRVITPFDRGLYERNGSYLYTNCGLGVTAQRVRICTPREISVMTLQTTAK